jgi:hypothetical protein
VTLNEEQNRQGRRRVRLPGLTLRILAFSSCIFSLGQLHSLAALFNELSNESRPSALVGRSNASPVFAVEVLQHTFLDGAYLR